MDWKNTFLNRLTIKLENEKGNFETIKDNEYLPQVLRHYYTFSSEQFIDGFKKENGDILVKMGININEPLPGIDDIDILNIFIDEMESIMKRAKNDYFIYKGFIYLIFIKAYIEVFEELIIEFKNSK